MTRREYLWITDVLGVQVGVIGRDFRELYVDTTLDQAETLHFTIPANHPKAYLLATEVQVRRGGRSYYVHTLSQERRGSDVFIKVVAPALWTPLGESDYVGSLVVDQLTPAGGGMAILAQTTWTVGAGSVGTGAYSMESQDRSHLANIRTWAKITGTVVEFDTQARTVSWLATRGADLGLAFRKGRNLRNVVRRRTPPTVTQLYPYGRDNLTIAGVNGGLEYVEDLSFYTSQGLTVDEARERFGKRRVIRDQSFVREAELLVWAQSQLGDKAQSIQQVELDVVDIAGITGLREVLVPGDRTRAYDPDFDEEFAAVVTRYVEHPLEPERTVVELSTSPVLSTDPDASTGRIQQSNEWIMFTGPIRADFTIRNDGDYTVARIPLRFRAGGRAHWHLDLTATGVGNGTMVVEIYDDEADVIVRTFSAPYTDGDPVTVRTTWAAEDLVGTLNYRLRVTTAADGGASPTNGVDLAIEDQGESSWYVLAQGAVQETPTTTTSVTFDYTGAIQQWTVPDNVEGPITITATGSKGGRSRGGNGGRVIATFDTVVPGTVYDVYVGGRGPLDASGGWPNGGGGAIPGSAGIAGGGGGGASYVVPEGGTMAAALLVAAGGGGGSVDQNGGAGGFFAGDPGVDGSSLGGGGATQVAGGIAGVASNPDWNGVAGTFDAGGRGGYGGGSLGNAGGCGGGGYYGGGGGGGRGSVNGDGPGGGGGGSGYVSPDGYDIEVADGVNGDVGQVTISWEAPDA